MSICNLKLSFLCLFFCCQYSLAADDVFSDKSPMLGESISIADAQEVDFVVLPNGNGLPKGLGDVDTGKQLFNIHCMACHGENAQGGINGDLVGGHGTINGPLPIKTVGSYWPYATILFDYIRRAMPYQTPGSLKNDDIYALTAYILFLNNIIGEQDIMNAKTLVKVEMPNRDNFVWAYKKRE